MSRKGGRDLALMSITVDEKNAGPSSDARVPAERRRDLLVDQRAIDRPVAWDQAARVSRLYI